jgi:hypothetical protein
MSRTDRPSGPRRRCAPRRRLKGVAASVRRPRSHPHRSSTTSGKPPTPVSTRDAGEGWFVSAGETQGDVPLLAVAVSRRGKEGGRGVVPRPSLPPIAACRCVAGRPPKAATEPRGDGGTNAAPRPNLRRPAPTWRVIAHVSATSRRLGPQVSTRESDAERLRLGRCHEDKAVCQCPLAGEAGLSAHQIVEPVTGDSYSTMVVPRSENPMRR